MLQPLSDQARSFLLEELGGTGFTSPEAVRYIQEAAKHLVVCSYPDHALTLYWVLQDESTYPLQMVRKVSKRAYNLVRIAGVTRPLVFWLIPAPGKRSLPTPGEMLQEKHINGGFTYTSNGNIFVYRKEELPKVVLHELLHHSKYHTDLWDPASLTQLYRHLRVDPGTRLLPNEAIVELWAEHYHILFLSEETGITYAMLWETEQRHARQQAIRLIGHYRGVEGALWRETTNGMSYLVLRAALFPYFHSELKKMPAPYDSRALTLLMMRAFDVFLSSGGVLSGTSEKGRHLRMTRTGDF